MTFDEGGIVPGPRKAILRPGERVMTEREMQEHWARISTHGPDDEPLPMPESTQGPDHELQPGEPALDILETVDFASGRPWSETIWGRIGAWWENRRDRRRMARVAGIKGTHLLPLVNADPTVLPPPAIIQA